MSSLGLALMSYSSLVVVEPALTQHKLSSALALA
jgi:hypothetical protein